MIDVPIPVDRNVMQKEAEKKLKYKSLCMEMQQMWNMKCMNILVIIGATSTVTNSLHKFWKPYQENIQQIQHKRQPCLEHYT